MLPPIERRQRIYSLALPIIGGMTSQNVLNLVDTAMVGRLGAAALAAVGMASFLNFLAVAAVTGMSSAVQAQAARRHGEGAYDQTAVSLNGGLLISLVYGSVAALLLFFLGEAIFTALIDDPAVVAEGVPYWHARVFVIAMVGMNFAFRGYWSAIDQTRLYLRTLLIMHVTNIVLNYVLIFGHFGFPALGTFGAGLGTAISIALGTVIYFVLALRHTKGSGFLERLPSATQMRSLLRLGIPSAVQQVLFAGGFTALFWIIAQVGTAELAVANVLINVTLVVILPGIGFGIAAATLAGQALGRRDPEDAWRWGWDVVIIGGAVFASLGLVMVLFAGPLLGVFLVDDALVELGLWPLRLIGLGIVFDGAGLILMQALLGAGASAVVMRVSVGMQWLLFLPAAYLLGPVLGFGLFAIWLAMSAYRLLQAAIFAFHWQARAWADIKV